MTNVDVTIDQGVIQGQAPQPFAWNGVQLPNFGNTLGLRQLTGLVIGIGTGMG